MIAETTSLEKRVHHTLQIGIGTGWGFKVQFILWCCHFPWQVCTDIGCFHFKNSFLKRPFLFFSKNIFSGFIPLGLFYLVFSTIFSIFCLLLPVLTKKIEFCENLCTNWLRKLPISDSSSLLITGYLPMELGSMVGILLAADIFSNILDVKMPVAVCSTSGLSSSHLNGFAFL